MYLSSTLDQSCFATIATVSEDSLEKLKLFSEYNISLISKFPKVILSTNKADGVSEEAVEQYHNAWRSLVKDIHIIHTEENKGHMFGTIDLEERILREIKAAYPEVKYLWKSMDDVITTSEILKIEVTEAEFYYIPGFSHESIVKAGDKSILHKIFEDYESGFWTPQTTFFILDISNIDSLYGDDVDPKSIIFEQIKAQASSIKPWEIPFDIKFDCETHLGRTTKDLTKCCLIEKQFDDLLEIVDYNKVGDPSHKNIYFEEPGICHYHYYKDLIYNV